MCLYVFLCVCVCIKLALLIIGVCGKDKHSLTTFYIHLKVHCFLEKSFHSGFIKLPVNRVSEMKYFSKNTPLLENVSPDPWSMPWPSPKI